MSCIVCKCTLTTGNSFDFQDAHSSGIKFESLNTHDIYYGEKKMCDGLIYDLAFLKRDWIYDLVAKLVQEKIVPITKPSLITPNKLLHYNDRVNTLPK